MYKELLTPYMAENQWIKPQPPATEAQIAEAEKKIGCAFPQELKTLLREINGDKWLLFSAVEIAENTQSIAEGLKEVYPDVDRHIFFASNGCGDYYCYNLLSDGTADESAIFIWEHETNETREVAKDIAQMIVRYYSDEI